MTLPASPRKGVKPDLKYPVAKGFWGKLFSRSPQVSLKTVKQQPSAPEVHTSREPLGRNLSRRKQLPSCSTQDRPQSEASFNFSIPHCKSNLRELGLTSPVVLTQPKLAGSETPLPRGKAVSQNMMFSSMRSVSSKMDRTSSSQPRPRLSRKGVSMTSDYDVNSEQPVLDITYSDARYAISTSSLPGLLSYGQASRMAAVEKFGEVPMPTAHDTVPSSAQNGEIPFSRDPPILSSSTPSGPSTSHSMHSHDPSSSPTSRTRRQRFPSVDSGRMSIASRHSQQPVPVEPASLFPVDEGLFGRPKLPPPLKVIPKKIKQHRRKETAPTSLLPTITNLERPPARISHNRSQTMHHTSFRQLEAPPTDRSTPSPHFLSSLPGSAAPPSLMSRSVPELPSPEHAQARSEHSLSRTSTYGTVCSDQSHQASFTLAPELPHNTKWTWTPPASWSGPSSASSTEGGDSPPGTKKPVFPAVTQLRRSKSSSKIIASAAKLFYSHPDTPSTTVAHSVATKLGNKGYVPPVREKKRECHGVIVKMQGFPGDDLKEAPLHDVIPRLRELKSSAL